MSFAYSIQGAEMFFARLNPSDPPQAPVDWNDIREGVLTYLNAGEIVFVSMTFGDDEVDAARKGKVPIGFRTDGEWAWSMEIAYYVAHYSMPIDPALLAHMRSLSFSCPPVRGETINQVGSELLRLAEEFSEPVEPI